MIKTVNLFKNITTDIYNKYLENGLNSYYIPMLVNSSFSIEVALKYLLNSDDIGYKKVHKLDDLWANLNSEYKICVRVYLNDVCQSPYTATYIDNKIREFSNIFAELRYSYEKDVVYVEPKFVLQFMYATAYVANYRSNFISDDKETFMLKCIDKMTKEEKNEVHFDLQY